MRLTRFMQAIAVAAMTASSMENSTTPIMQAMGGIPSPRNRKGEIKKDFKHNPRNNIRTKAKRK